ncbi:bifunctional alpha,alpha-trehalose-phosphate synthase (UDP-forming)/trehalose-phosphatase [Planctomycetes bacterium Poly30]|uniref:bifunctional alpha,alpha-trehalose-phosphate synthase (UDP-forming)/trehalose-phosphatase n=1 Tax=Saltatorellus ferox TaxID=2528018 RepID=UPI0011AB269E
MVPPAIPSLGPSTARPRLLLVSNRLPVKLKRTESGGWTAERTLGGLATGLSGPHQESGGVWIGWPGVMTEDEAIPADAQALLKGLGFHGLGLSEEEHERYYLRASNRCIWPLLHGFVERVEFDREDWNTYRRVNQRFADAVCEEAQRGDTVFVQDFQLCLVPAMIREKRPDLRIGFFLHVPFPHTGIFRALPSRAETLKGLLGADVIGFHTLEYLRCFRSAARRVLGVETTSHTVEYQARQVSLVAQPLGIDPTPWERPDDTPEIAEPLAELKAAAAGRKVLLGVERLDYTKGILERLTAFRDLLEERPELAEKVVFFQIAVPSRIEVDAYRDLKEKAEQLAGEINSRFGRVGVQPLHYQFHGVDPGRLTALYRVADVCVVTPLRDGLNLVAKEFVAARHQDDGVLLLSEFTGAAWELTEALHVNPYDLDAMKSAYVRALEMSPEEQAARMAPMRERVHRDDIHHWTRSMLDAIENSQRSSAPELIEDEIQEDCLRRWGAASDRFLALDYDGTLRELQVDPLTATPAPELIERLEALVATPGNEVWIVSGRTLDFLTEHLGGTGVGFIGEHGRVARAPGAREPEQLVVTLDPSWKDRIRPMLESVTGRVHGSHVEEKPEGLAWHYRGAEPESAAWQAHELYQHLGEIMADENLEIMRGNKVLEIRPSGISKANGLATVLGRRAKAPDLVVIAGDDVTDESMFRAFPEALSVLVGSRASSARFRVEAPENFRTLLGLWHATAPAGTSHAS